MNETIKTDRLHLRVPELMDADIFHQESITFEVVRMTSTWPWPCPAPFVRKRFGAMATYDGKTHAVFGIFTEDHIIGLCGLHQAHQGNYEIGYMLGPRWWGMGYASEATRALCQYGFDVMGAASITGERWYDNPASGRVMEKVGFVPTGPVAPSWCEARQEKVAGFQYHLTRDTLIDEGLTK